MSQLNAPSSPLTMGRSSLTSRELKTTIRSKANKYFYSECSLWFFKLKNDVLFFSGTLKMLNAFTPLIILNNFI